MALQGNPFLGKLKVPAPDLSRIPETPFDSKEPKNRASSAEPPAGPYAPPDNYESPADALKEILSVVPEFAERPGQVQESLLS